MMKGSPPYYMLFHGNTEARSIRFSVNLRTPDTIYCIAFIYLLIQSFKGRDPRDFTI